MTEEETNIDDGNIILAGQIIRRISDKIVSHALEEEARLMRIIMHKAIEESTELVKIMQDLENVKEALQALFAKQ